MTLFEFNKRFTTEQDALDFIIAKKYKNGCYVCPNCGCTHNVYRSNIKSRNLYCNNCNSHFSALNDTIFENSHLDLRMWLYAINLVLVARKGISACQLQRELGMKTYVSAWRMLHKIRRAISKEQFYEVFEAVVEIDETYVGGRPRKENKHDARETNEKHNKRGRGTSKTPIVGVKERNTGRVYAVVANKNEDGKQISGKQLFNILKRVCKDNTLVMTDQLPSYNILNKPNEKNLVRLMVDHNVMYSLGNGIHTNGIESFWAIVKRGIYGVFHHISVKHMQSYMNEFCFRINHRDVNDAFNALVELAVA